MRDMFDEFMEELRRRAAAERGESGEKDRAGGAGEGEAEDASRAEGEHQGGEGQTEAGEPATASAAGESGEGAGAGGTGTDEAEGGEPEAEEAPAEGDGEEEEEKEEREPEPLFRRPAAGGTGGRRPPGRRTGDQGRRGYGAGIVIAIIVVALLILGSVAGVILDLWTDAIWFASIGFSSVFWTRIWAQVLLFIGATVAAAVILYFNLWLAGRLAPKPGSGGPSFRDFFDRLTDTGRPGGFEQPRAPRREGPGGGPWRAGGRPGGLGGLGGRGAFGGPRGPGGLDEFPELPDLTPLLTWALIIVAAFVALTIAGGIAGNWEQILLWAHQVPYSPNPATPVTDPIFHKDIGFYLFELPFLRLVQNNANWILLAALALSAGRYLVAYLRSGAASVPTSIRVHLAVLGGLYLLSVAAGYQLDKFELVYSTQGVATGVSYTDENARFLALNVLTVIAALAAAFLVGGSYTGMNWPLGLSVVAWFVASVVLGQIYPALVQRFSVEPNQFAQEQPYIQKNISMTRLAYGLDTWSTQQYDGTGTLTAAAIQQDSATFDNARLWDYRPLGTTLDQLQTVRTYYDFPNVDTDRYVINGEERQVMLSARELATSKLATSTGAQLSWVNQRITYTHGVGLAMVPVNEVTTEGQPQLIIRDLPPVSSAGAPVITQPRIYFGTEDDDWVIVGAQQPEFDYPSNGTSGASPAPSPSSTPSGSPVAGSPAPSATPSPTGSVTLPGGDVGVTTTWTGTTGVKLDSTLSRLLFALRFRDLNLLISDQVTAESQLLLHQTLSDRLPRIAPFLQYDGDPYMVVTSSGRLVWVQDAYTTSSYFPNAQAIDPTQLPSTSGLAGSNPFDYIRNSVKIVVDAYDGTTTFYAADPSDPILRAYEGVFPGLFHDMSQMPSDLRAHLRVPEDLFNVQTRMFAAYHVTDPQTFYSNNDLWTLPTNPTVSDQTLPLEPYYTVMRLPDQTSPEFLLLQPMVPKGRPNMIAWVAARNDGSNYGGTRVYEFPRDTTIFGPSQIEARIDQDPTISSQITLWNQSGSTVVRGNLIVVPVGNSLIYFEPIYLQSTSSRFPEFKRIVVASTTTVAWADNLGDALNVLLAGGNTASPTPSPSPSPSPGASASPSPGASASPGATPQPGNIQALVTYANLHFQLAQQALKNGDFATYGAEMKIVQATLQQLSALLGTPAPSSSASPAP